MFDENSPSTSPNVNSTIGLPSPRKYDQEKLPREQTTFHTHQSRLLAKSKQTTFIHDHHQKAYSWKYDEPDLHQAIKSGAFQVDSTLLKEDYLNWENDASIITVQNLEGNKVKMLASKRGNPSYARKQRKKMNNLIDAMKDFKFSEPFGGREHLQRCWAILITLTIDHNLMTAQEAWAGLSNAITKFKIQAKRELGVQNIECIVSKEGTKSDYPSPHILVVSDSPQIVYPHKSGSRKHLGQITYRLRNYDLVTRLQKAWKHGYIDVQGVVDGQVIDQDNKSSMGAPKYLFKYLVKAVQVNEEEGLEGNTALNTVAFQKLFRLRAIHISKTFKQRFVRLDTLTHESQQSGSTSYSYIGREYCKLKDFYAILYPSPPDRATNPIVEGESANNSL